MKTQREKDDYIEEVCETLVNDFNVFIKEWCPSYAHLIDCDENDGERFRINIKKTIRTALEEQKVRLRSEVEKLDMQNELTPTKALSWQEGYERGLEDILKLLR